MQGSVSKCGHCGLDESCSYKCPSVGGYQVDKCPFCGYDNGCAGHTIQIADAT